MLRYKCECGWEGERLSWVEREEKVNGGVYKVEALGCPICKELMSSGAIKRG